MINDLFSVKTNSDWSLTRKELWQNFKRRPFRNRKIFHHLQNYQIAGQDACWRKQMSKYWQFFLTTFSETTFQWIWNRSVGLPSVLWRTLMYRLATLLELRVLSRFCVLKCIRISQRNKGKVIWESSSTRLLATGERVWLQEMKKFRALVNIWGSFTILWRMVKDFLLRQKALLRKSSSFVRRADLVSTKQKWWQTTRGFCSFADSERTWRIIFKNSSVSSAFTTRRSP